MKVKALKEFNDIKSKKNRVVDEMFEVTQDRYEEILAADKENPLVELLEDDTNEPPGKSNDKLSNSEYPKHIGGGQYELSNGEKVKGKDAAMIAQVAINAAND